MHLSENNLSHNILKTVAYFDLFDYPLTNDQVFNYLSQNSVTINDVGKAIDNLVDGKQLVRENAFVFLPDTDRSIVGKRKENEIRARKRLSTARIISRFVKMLPFVRGVFITGSLSKNVAEPSSDIDFMIITAPHRVWICRTLLTSFRKIFLLGRSKYFCTNFYLSENCYTHQEKNIYTAIEVVTTKVIWNESAFIAYQQQNYWVKSFLPNISIVADRSLLISSSRSLIQKCIEMILNLLPLHPLNISLMEIHKKHWQRVFKSNTENQLNSMFIISPDVSSGWPENCQDAILEEYHKRLSSLGIQDVK